MNKPKKRAAYIGTAAALALAGTLVVWNTRDGLPPSPPGYYDTGATSAPIILPKAFAVVPGKGLSFTDVERLPGGALLLAWNAVTHVTVSSGPAPNGPWSAVTNLVGSAAAVPLYASNRFYQLSVSSLKTERFWIGGSPVFSFVGNNDVSFIINDLEWWQSSFDYLMTVTNNVVSGFPLTTANMPSCAPFATAIDDVNWKYFTLETGCYYGFTGPYTFREWQLVGAGGFFTNAIPISGTVIGGEFGSTPGDMIRLKSGGFVACWKSPSSNYCFAYRSPVGDWKPIWCETTTTQASSTMELGQHPDGTIYCLVTRDGYHWIPVMVFEEINDQLVYQQTIHGVIEQEGEWSKVSIVADHEHWRLLASRAVKPYYFFQAGEGILTIKGGAFQTAQIYNQADIAEGPRRPVGAEGWSYTNHIPEIVMLNSTEVINAHATTLANGKLWAFFQEYNPTKGNFSLVYAQPWNDTDGWGDRFFLYEAPWSDNYRGYAMNGLVSYRNCNPNGSRVLFANTDEHGELVVFELR